MSALDPQEPHGRWHYRRSLASRVTMLTTIAVGVTVAFVACGVYVTVRMQLQAAVDNQLIERAQSAPTALCDTTVPSEYLGAADSWIVCFTDAIAVTDRVPEFDMSGGPELEVINGDARKSVRTIESTDGKSEWRVVAVNRGGGQTMLIAQSLDTQESVLRRLGIVMFLFGTAGVIAAGMAGWAVAQGGLRPVRRLTAAVEEIARTEDLRPLPIEGDDEIARLAAAFNQMLVALEASRERQRQLVADASHELRTPLTSLRTNLDLLSQVDSDEGALPPGAREELLGDVRAQIEEMTNLIGDLVELARDEALNQTVEPVDLADVVDRAAARVRRRAQDVTIDVQSDPWFVIGESSTVERAVTNLLDNAAKWSPAGGTVTVRLADGTLTVEDEGPGIAEEDLPHIFDRFYRSQESRAMPGSGLGLAIVRQVAERHSGTVEAGTSASGGARLELWLPGSSSPVPPPVPAS
ncbi:cell wall metabolism sensor histidine kinase WalK [Nocardioides sp. SR21]|uniref:sensor histidine kinase n=1 Tax=Nocardioides sp. SR21 TaxID=2919501 RepID=UPI001FAA6C3D|nr:HAMP domain-containing sensor histidine kinase [Nocardioides sp. SR21]